MVTINIQKKDLYLICAILVFFVAVGFVIAYGGNNPSVMGHNAAEVTGTIVGACSVVCNIGEGSNSYQSCGGAGMWGAGYCNSTTSGSCNTICLCNQGNRQYVGSFYVYGNPAYENFSTTKAPGRAIALNEIYLCITP